MSTTQPPVGTPWHGATFTAAFPRFWRGYTVFGGRAARAEFWWWALWWFIIAGAVNAVYGVGLFGMFAAPPSPPPASVEQAMTEMNPFPVWGWLLSSMPPLAQGALIVFGVIGVVALLPWIAIAARRLHDTNRSAWWLLLYLVPIGNLVVLVFVLLPSDERGARFDRRAAVISRQGGSSV